MSQGSANFILEFEIRRTLKKNQNSFRFGEFQRRTSRRTVSNRIEPQRTRTSSEFQANFWRISKTNFKNACHCPVLFICSGVHTAHYSTTPTLFWTVQCGTILIKLGIAICILEIRSILFTIFFPFS